MMDFKNLFDIRIYNYFLNHERLADFLNAILFDGQMIMDTQDIIILDSNSSGIFLSSGQTIKRTRDHLLLVSLNGQQCLIGLEHQSYVDKGMFQRIMEYDYLSYLKQEMKRQRSIQVEGAFGVIKQDMKYVRLRRRGKTNVRTEIFLIGIAYNIRKYHNKKMRNRKSAFS